MYDVAVASIFKIIYLRHLKPFLIFMIEQLFNCNYKKISPKSQELFLDRGRFYLGINLDFNGKNSCNG
jgi:hypothetical protein